MKKQKIVIIGVIFLISFLLYYPPFYEKDLDYVKEGCCNFSITLPVEDFDKPSPINTLKKITSPFELKYYDVYFYFPLNADLSCYPIYPKNVSYILEGSWKSIEVGEKEFIKSLKLGEDYSLLLSDLTYFVNADYDIPAGSMALYNVTVGTELRHVISARMNWWDAGGNIFIFFFFWIGVLFLIKEIIEWIEEKKLKV